MKPPTLRFTEGLRELLNYFGLPYIEMESVTAAIQRVATATRKSFIYHPGGYYERQWIARRGVVTVQRRKPTDATHAHYVTVYSVTRQYGGPEEGGWYYDHLEPIFTSRRMHHRRIRAAVSRYHALFKHLEEGDISSVLGGRAISIIAERTPRHFATRVKPHYE